MAPTFLSAAGTTFRVGEAGTFHVVAAPSVTSITMTGGVLPSGVTYTTRAEAEAGMKTVKVCTN